MATGDTLIAWAPGAANFPNSLAATYDERNAHLVLDFDASTDEEAHFVGFLPQNYAGSGIDVHIWHAASTATSGNVVLGSSFERIQAGTTDIDSDSFAAEQTTTVATAATSGVPSNTTIAHTNGAQIDSLAVGELFRLKIRRLGSNGSDTMTGDLELLGVYLEET
jgi:hypothetical protein